MATRTTNYNLYKPDSSDPFEDFRAEHNANMDIIDANLGGGGGGSGNVDDVEVNGVSVLDPVTKVAEITSYEEVTQAEYNALPADKLSNGIAYFIKDSVNGADGFPPLIYSLEERQVGVWTDGKPLYQKSVVSSDVLALQINTWVQTSVNIADVENVIGTTLYGNNAVFIVSGAMTNTGYVQVNSPRTLSLNNGYVLTVLYTKTTDVAGSGDWSTSGALTAHYSTSEKVVGTWIDGKPLYEITLNFGSISANSAKTIDVSSLNIDFVTSFDSTARLDNGVIVPIPISHTVNMGSQHFCRYNSTGNFGIYTGSGQAITQAYLTARYTKTTD